MVIGLNHKLKSRRENMESHLVNSSWVSYKIYDQQCQHHCSKNPFYCRMRWILPVGDMVVSTIKKLKQELRRMIHPAVVIWQWKDVMFIYAGDNAGALINNKDEMFWHHISSCRGVYSLVALQPMHLCPDDDLSKTVHTQPWALLWVPTGAHPAAPDPRPFKTGFKRNWPPGEQRPRAGSVFEVSPLRLCF